MSQPQSQSRDDAVAVYRWLCAVRGEGGATVPEIAFQCFALPAALSDPDVTLPDSVIVRLRRLPITRTLDALVWLRGEGGVTVRARPDAHGLTRFSVA